MAKKILIIDDEDDILTLLRSRLEVNGFEVITARDGLEGLEKARQESPDLIVLDVMMPKMDGFQVCRMLKFDKQCEDIPVILLTAKTKESDKEIGEEIQADAYIVKPFDSQVLMGEINKLLER